MHYYEVYVADSGYKNSKSLTYSYPDKLSARSLVSVPLRRKVVSAIVAREVKQPKFEVKNIKAVVSEKPLPKFTYKTASWMSDYYATSLGEALKLFTLPRPIIRPSNKSGLHEEMNASFDQLQLDMPLNSEQQRVINEINQSPSHTVLLHGDTGTGKTRIYVELAKSVLSKGKSAIILTPEIALTAQLVSIFEGQVSGRVYAFHSQHTYSQRKKTWLDILNSKEPVIVVGARSALFSPVEKIGLIILDEAHEPSYKQDQAPRYHTARVASQMGLLAGAKVLLGTATPLATDYYLADQHKAIVRIRKLALGEQQAPQSVIVDKKNSTEFTSSPYLSDQLLTLMESTLKAGKQVLIYLNRRGSARLILCSNCGWQMDCPNCDIPLVYHGDIHKAQCHICGFNQSPPSKCPSCMHVDILFKSIGTKALADSLESLFTGYKLKRFDSDNRVGERVNEIYPELVKGGIDIIVGTQILAKGLDLPKLGLVGIVTAEDSLALPDYSAEERAFQLLYQVMGRVGRGHGKGSIVIQTYHPESTVIRSAINKDYLRFYEYLLKQRQGFRFPPYSYLLKLIIRKNTSERAQSASEKLKSDILAMRLHVEVLGPTPSFYSRRGKNFYWQLVIKSKNRKNLINIARYAPAEWKVDLDPIDLL